MANGGGSEMTAFTSVVQPLASVSVRLQAPGGKFVSPEPEPFGDQAYW